LRRRMCSVFSEIELKTVVLVGEEFGDILHGSTMRKGYSSVEDFLSSAKPHTAECVAALFTLSDVFATFSTLERFIEQVKYTGASSLCVAYWDSTTSLHSLTRYSLLVSSMYSNQDYGCPHNIQIAPDPTTRRTYCVLEDQLREATRALGLIERPVQAQDTTGHALHPDYARLALQLRLRYFHRRA
jgi:hypothetical protein